MANAIKVVEVYLENSKLVIIGVNVDISVAKHDQLVENIVYVWVEQTGMHVVILLDGYIKIIEVVFNTVLGSINHPLMDVIKVLKLGIVISCVVMMNITGIMENMENVKVFALDTFKVDRILDVIWDEIVEQTITVIDKVDVILFRDLKNLDVTIVTSKHTSMVMIIKLDENRHMDVVMVCNLDISIVVNLGDVVQVSI